MSLRTSLEQNHSILDRCGSEQAPSCPSLWAGLGGIAAGKKFCWTAGLGREGRGGYVWSFLSLQSQHWVAVIRAVLQTGHKNRPKLGKFKYLLIHYCFYHLTNSLAYLLPPQRRRLVVV